MWPWSRTDAGIFTTMTGTYDSHDPLYLDEADVRVEIGRTLNVCYECRQCVDKCSVFPRAFSIIDTLSSHDASILSSHDAQMMTPAQQDEVIDACYQCKMCVLGCPYSMEHTNASPDSASDATVHVPRLMLRAQAMRRDAGLIPVTHRVADAILHRTDAMGKIGVTLSSAANAITTAPPRSLRRKLLSVVTGMSTVRVLPPFAKQRFSTWFRERASRSQDASHTSSASVAVFPTCTVEYHEPDIGKAVVAVYEHNNIACSLPNGIGCCGAPFLHGGDVAAFVSAARKNVDVLTPIVREGSDVVVPQPTCSLTMKQDYVEYLDTEDAALVARHVFDTSEYLALRQRLVPDAIRTEFVGELPSHVVVHVPCHMRAQHAESHTAEMLQRIGAPVHDVTQCAGIDGLWGLKARHDDMSLPVSRELARCINETVSGENVSGETVIGETWLTSDCHLAGQSVVGQVDLVAMHPMQALARAYGLATE
jgi:glycerol-3-phosphate dehydrogenase subunit C